MLMKSSVLVSSSWRRLLFGGSTYLSQQALRHNHVTSMASSNQPVIVIGAGVIGLSAATVIQKRHPNSKITLIAAETPSLPANWTSSIKPSADYASMWAGAHYRPIPRSTRQLNEEMDMAWRTAELMYEIIEQSPEAGVATCPAIEYLENPPEEVLALKSGIPYAGPNDQFRVMEKSELPEGVKFGYAYNAYAVNTHVYCSWLLRNFLEKGGYLIHKRLASAEDAFEQPGTEPVQVVVNCSGRNFDRDSKMKIIRGQTVLVKNKYHSTITRQNTDGSWVFTIPRPLGAGTIIGGTKEIDDEETEARPESREKLLAEAVRCFPDLVDDVSKFEVIMDNVGRRPWREGGLRMEMEQLSDTKTVIHGYGAGGRGYELSWGVAERLADLYDQSLKNPNGYAG